MGIEDCRIVITGAARDFGRTLAVRFAALGAELYISSRDPAGAQRTRDEILARDAAARIYAFACDLSSPASIRDFAARVRERTDHVDILVNNGAGWLEGADLDSADDQQIVDTITSGGAGTVLMVKHFLPLLTASTRPDIVTMVSTAALPHVDGCSGHNAFYAAKGAQAAFVGILSTRLRSAGIRVISMYPPDYRNIDPFGDPARVSRTDKDELTAESIVECVVFAVNQPRDCFIRTFEFETR
jgi:NAD(P)-dependent dehydrogenase (short-subunit alcohol dehydrogenase family)